MQSDSECLSYRGSIMANVSILNNNCDVVQVPSSPTEALSPFPLFPPEATAPLAQMQNLGWFLSFRKTHPSYTFKDKDSNAL